MIDSFSCTPFISEHRHRFFKNAVTLIADICHVVMTLPFSSPEKECSVVVSQCQLSAVRRLSCASSGVCSPASTIALKAYSSYNPGPVDLKLGRKYQSAL